MCGEQIYGLYKHFYIPGSPPHVRGTAIEKKPMDISQRITPACAGNSDPKIANISSGQDHPRMCGEQDLTFKFSYPHQGSPPHVRGTVDISTAAGTSPRITPACAGNSAHRL